jgi:hypothetical protein
LPINYLYFRHQVSLFRADHAACEPSRRAHQGLAAGYLALLADAKANRADAR